MVPFRGRCRRLVVSSILFLSYFTTARKKALWSQRWANALNFRNEKSSLDTDGPQAMRDRSSKDYNDNSKIDMILKKRKKKRGRAIGSSWNGIKCIRIQVQYFRFIFCFCQLYTPTENAVASLKMVHKSRPIGLLRKTLFAAYHNQAVFGSRQGNVLPSQIGQETNSSVGRRAHATKYYHLKNFKNRETRTLKNQAR